MNDSNLPLETYKYKALSQWSSLPLKVPVDKKAAGLVIYDSGLLSAENLQPGALALTNEFIYIHVMGTNPWWEPIGNIRRVVLRDMPGVSIPTQAPDGQQTLMRLGSNTKGIVITYQREFNEFELVLVTFHPAHARNWVQLINGVRLQHEKDMQEMGKSIT